MHGYFILARRRVIYNDLQFAKQLASGPTHAIRRWERAHPDHPSAAATGKYTWPAGRGAPDSCSGLLGDAVAPHKGGRRCRPVPDGTVGRSNPVHTPQKIITLSQC